MKIFLALILISPTVFAQTTKATNSDSAQLITTAGSVSLSPEETATLKRAIQAAQQAHISAQSADAALQDVQKTIAANHAAPVDGPYQIVSDFSTTIEQIPAPAIQVWKKVADEGDVVLIKAGTTVRYGAAKGAANIYATGGVLTADTWNLAITYAVDTTLTVNNSSFGPDPVVGSKKELDQLGTPGGVTKVTPQ